MGGGGVRGGGGVSEKKYKYMVLPVMPTLLSK